MCCTDARTSAVYLDGSRQRLVSINAGLVCTHRQEERSIRSVIMYDVLYHKAHQRRVPKLLAGQDILTALCQHKRH
jgi:hypothetical protein